MDRPNASRSTEHGTRTAYRGRLAPSPTGFLHLGHARTFWIAQRRAEAAGGTLVLRNEDLDRARCKPEFVDALLEDLRWFGFRWQEGPDCGGASGPYSQSERHHLYVAALEGLRAGGFIYPCTCSRQDVLRALQAPHAAEDEPIYPGTCRPEKRVEGRVSNVQENQHSVQSSRRSPSPLDPQRSTLPFNWRFRVPDGEGVSFVDGHFGPQRFVAGEDFGDFIVWRD